MECSSNSEYADGNWEQRFWCISSRAEGREEMEEVAAGKISERLSVKGFLSHAVAVPLCKR